MVRVCGRLYDCNARLHAVSEGDLEVEGSGHHNLHDIGDVVSLEPHWGDGRGPLIV
jgi:hypothetical protein